MLFPLITTPYVTRVLTNEGYGIYSYTFTNIQYFVLIAGLGITIYGNREIAYSAGEKNKYYISRVFWEIVILKFISTLIAIILFLILLLFNVRYKLLMCVQVLNILNVAFDISWLYMGLEKFSIIVFRNTLIKLFSLALIFLFVKNQDDLLIYILIMAGSLLGGNLTLWPQLKSIVEIVPVRKLHPLRHLRASLLLFLPQVAIQFYMQINKTALGIMISPKDSGYYYSSDTIIKVLLSVVTATGTVMLPHASKAFSEGKVEQVKKMLYHSFDFVSFISIPMAFGVAAVSLKMAPWFLGRGYSAVGKVMMIESIIIVLDAWGNVIGEQYLLPIKQTRKYTNAIIMGTITNLIIFYPFIKLWGLFGAMISYCLSELAVFVYQLLIVRNSFNLGKIFYNFKKYFISGLLMFVIVFYINSILDMSFLSLSIEVLVGILCYILAILCLKPIILIMVTKYLKR
ncbi:polysaccharide biosynthesis C-terminal domain-containing protein [Limosilactobacillus sp. Sa3CUN2]|uniref:Polysaccharide biosynthesis C-terminal domain-containing protein n=2 Tax=Limosilactobacillus avistercoris TaxID=2762243 RepID=A0ABR8PEW6_9LACO|nr:polysaccharide biosynthesis C-terminal domain-containing protein [Limosilactobacillus avistercoris]